MLSLKSPLLGACGIMCLAASSAPALAAPTVANGSFEDPALGYGGYVYTPTVSGATFNEHSGVAHNGSPFASALATEGTQIAFVQSTAGSEGRISLDVAGLTVGSVYSFVFDAVQRPSYANNVLSVFFNGTGLGTFAAADTTFGAFTTAAFTATGATGVLTFAGATTTTGDNDVAIDNIRVSGGAVVGAVPEPATWGLTILGFGAVGGALRRRPAVRALA